MTHSSIILAMAFCAMATGAKADDGMLVYTSTTEQPSVFGIDNVKEIQFSSNEFTVVPQEGEPTTFVYAELSKITFDYDSSNSIQTISDSELQSNNVEIYDLQGRRTTISATSPTGVYIVKKNGQTLKMLKR